MFEQRYYFCQVMYTIAVSRHFILIFLLCHVACVIGFSQPTVFKADAAAAKHFYSIKNYTSAIKVYLLLLKKEPEHVEYNQMIAKCYMLSNSIKAKAIPHLEFLTKQEKFPDDVWLDLGRAYHFSNRFDEALKSYNTYKEKVINDKKATGEVQRYIEQVYNGKELIKNPLEISFENLGKGINCEFPDYYPIISPDGSCLYFTSRRKSPTAQMPEFDGLYPSDIFSGQLKDGQWQKIQSIASVNTNLDEQVVDVSDDGTILLFYIDRVDVFGDIWISRRLNNKMTWLKSEPVSANINAGFESSASIFKDPATEMESILLASSRPGKAGNPNFGKTDIYISRKLPNGIWSDPQNLGPNINTEYKEEFPQFSEDGKTLYFASEGHSSMGGFDIFKSVWNETEQTWSSPKNMGYPINTSGDDLNISFTSDGRIAYLSTLREGGMGDLDIYKLILKNIEPKESVYKGYISSTDTLHKGKKIKIEILNKANNALFGIYTPDPNNSYYVMALPPGKWIMKAEADGYVTYSEEITINEQVLKFSPEVTKNIKLIKK